MQNTTLLERLNFPLSDYNLEEIGGAAVGPVQVSKVAAVRKGTSSQFRGVCWGKGIKKWVAHAMRKVGDKTESHSVGCFTDEQLAARGYDKAMLFLNGLVRILTCCGAACACRQLLAFA